MDTPDLGSTAGIGDVSVGAEYDGYPNGLKGEEIPLVGRSTSIADVFDAMTSMRPYKKAWPVEDAVAFIKREAGTSFDPELVQKFVALLPQILAVREKYSDALQVGHGKLG